MNDQVLNTSATIKLDGTPIAVSGFSVNYGLNAVSTASLSLALGKGFSIPSGTTQAKVVSPGAITEGSPVEIWYGQGKKGNTQEKLIFRGFVNSVSPNRSEDVGSAKMGASVDCAHELSLLGGLPVLARGFFPMSTGQVYDTYRGEFGGGVSQYANALKGLSDSNNLKQNVGEWIVGCLKAMYLSEKNDTGLSRTVMPGAVEALDNLRVASQMFVASPQIDYASSLLKGYVTKLISMGWKDNNGLALMMGALSKVFGHLSPTGEGGYIAPSFPLSKIASRRLSSGEIFSLRKISEISVNKTVGVVMLGVDRTDDVQVKKDSSIGIQWPPPSTKTAGVYQYVDIPEWANMTRQFFVGVPPAPTDTKTRDNPQGGSDMLKPESQTPVSPQETRQYMERVAKTIFMTQKWVKNNIIISVPLSFNTAPGAVIEMDLSGTKDAIPLFGGTNLFGQVQTLSIGASFSGFSSEARIGFVRTKEENDKLGFDTHPLYQGYRMERLPLF